MSKSLKFLLLGGFVLFVAACAREPETVIVEVPVEPEPVYNKY
jgi:hypothetical protein